MNAENFFNEISEDVSHVEVGMSRALLFFVYDGCDKIYDISHNMDSNTE